MILFFAVLNADMIGFAPLPSDGTQGKIFENANIRMDVDYTKAISQTVLDYIGLN